MNKKYIIKENTEIEKVVKTGKKSVSKFFVIYYIENDNTYNMYCVSVSKKLGKANIRNKIKRKVKDILMKNKMDLKRKYVIIIRKDAHIASYEELTMTLINQIKGE